MIFTDIFVALSTVFFGDFAAEFAVGSFGGFFFDDLNVFSDRNSFVVRARAVDVDFIGVVIDDFKGGDQIAIGADSEWYCVIHFL